MLSPDRLCQLSAEIHEIGRELQMLDAVVRTLSTYPCDSDIEVKLVDTLSEAGAGLFMKFSPSDLRKHAIDRQTILREHAKERAERCLD